MLILAIKLSSNKSIYVLCYFEVIFSLFDWNKKNIKIKEFSEKKWENIAKEPRWKKYYDRNYECKTREKERNINGTVETPFL